MIRRFHLRRGGQKTTVSIDSILSELLAFKLGRHPDDADAPGAVREWLQDRLDSSIDPTRIHLSQWLQARIIEEIASLELREKRDEWLDGRVAGRKGRRRQNRPDRARPARVIK
jgi:hypothetical protein